MQIHSLLLFFAKNQSEIFRALLSKVLREKRAIGGLARLAPTQSLSIVAVKQHTIEVLGVYMS